MGHELKEKLMEGNPVFGPFMKFTDPAAFEMVGLAGFDFAIIDMEHGPVGFERAQDLIRAARLRGLTPVVRVPENREIYIQRALDIGAGAIQVPQVSTAEAAVRVVKASKFHPAGERGVCRYVRAADYASLEKEKYFKKANLDTLVIIHIEGIEGINNLEEIVSVEGIDIIFIGPYDLSQSCGFPGQTDHPDVVEKMKWAVETARKNGKVAGTFVESTESAKKWISCGVQYISYAVDTGIFFNACKVILNELKVLNG